MTLRGIGVVLTGVAAVLGCALCLASCRRGGAEGGPTPGASGKSRLHVEVDPRVELISIVRLLSRRDPALETLPFPYAAKVREHFARFKDDPSLARFARAERVLGGGDVPVWVVLHCSPPPELARVAPMNPLIAEVIPQPDAPEEVLSALRDFAGRSGFVQFFAECRPDYDRIAEAFLRGMDAEALLRSFEAYYGQALSDYRIIPAPMLSGTNYGPHVVRADGTMQPYVVVARRRTTARAPEFGDATNLPHVLWHEFGHPIVNPLVHGEKDRLLPLAKAIVPNSGKIGPGNYGFRCETYVSEYVIRAIGIRLTRQVLGERQAAEELRQITGAGLKHMPALCAELERYEQQRERYPKFASFFPELVTFFEKLAAELGNEAERQKAEGRKG